MYYYLYKKGLRIITRLFSTFLILSVSFITFQTCVFADLTEKSIEEYRRQGYEAQQKGDLETALSFYAKAVYLQPTPALYNDIGVIYEQIGAVDKAIHSYNEALLLDEHYVPAYSNLAYLYEKQGDLEQAAEYLKKRIEWGEPDDIWTKRAKKKLAYLSKKLPHYKNWIMHREAQDLAREITEKKRDEFQWQLTRSNELCAEAEKLIDQKKYIAAIMRYNQALELTPDNPKIIRARDDARLTLINNEAQRHADTALKFLNMGDTRSAKVEFRKILTIIPDEPIRISK